MNLPVAILSLLPTLVFGQIRSDSLFRSLKTADLTGKARIYAQLATANIQTDKSAWLTYLDSATYYARKSKNQQAFAYVALSKGAYYYYRAEMDSAFDQFNRALGINRLTGNHVELVKSLNNTAMVRYKWGDYDEARLLWEEAIRINSQQGILNGSEIYASNIGNCYIYQDKYYKALDYYLKSHDLAVKLKDTMSISSALNNIGMVQSHFGLDSLAYRYYSESHELAKSSGNKRAEAISLITKSLAEKDLGMTDKSIVNLKKAMGMMRELGSNYQVVKVLVSLGDIYAEQQDTITALGYYEQALALNDSVGGNLTNYAMIYPKLSNWLLVTGNSTRALSLALKGVDASRQVKSLIGLKMSYGVLANVYGASGDYQKAYAYQKLFSDYSDSLRNESLAQEIVELEGRYRYDLQEKEKNAALKLAENERTKGLLIKRLSKEQVRSQARKKHLWRWVSGGILVLFVLLLLLYRNMQRANKRLKVATDKAVKSEKIKDKFLANTSHEIRTPMHAIKGLSYLLQQSELSPEQRRQVSIISASSDHMLNVVNDILDISKIEAGRLEFNNIGFDPEKVIDEVLDVVKHQADDKGIYVRKKGTSGGQYVKGDPVRFRQMVLNLVYNAVKFTSEGGVDVFVSYEMPDLEVRVCDTGSGMTDAEKKMVFDPFDQLGKSSTAMYGGTGLGLKITKDLVDLLNGEIIVSDNPETEGTVFTIRLKMQPAQEQGESKSNNLVHVQNLRILLADDETTSRNVSCALLQTMGAEVVECGDGRSALALVKSERFDLVFLDFHMPKMDGFQVAAKIRHEPTLDTLPLIGITASSAKEEKSRAMKAGMSDVVHKPFGTHELGSVFMKYFPEKAIEKSNSVVVTQDELAYLKSITGGDRKRMKKMLQEFTRVIPDHYNLAIDQLRGNRFTDAKRNLHKLKPMFAYVGNVSLSQRIATIEANIQPDRVDPRVLKELLTLDKQIKICIDNVCLHLNQL